MVGLNRHMLRSFSFTNHPERRSKSRGATEHVFFGDARLSVDKGIGGKDHNFRVVIKPYLEAKDSSAAAIHEYAGSVILNESKYVETFRPLGIWVDEDRHAFLISSWVENAASLDNLTMSQLTNSESPRRALLDRRPPAAPLHIAAGALALLHAQGFSHGNAQINNFSQHPKQQSLLVFDLLNMRRICLPDAQPKDQDALRLEIFGDLKRLIGSVARQLSTAIRKDSDWREVVSDHIVEPYLHTVAQTDLTPVHELCSSGAIDLPSITRDLLDLL